MNTHLKTSRVLAVAVVCGTLAATAAAQDTAGLVGKTVMVIEPAVVLKVKSDTASWTAVYGDFIDVTSVAGDWLWIGKRKGYVKRESVLGGMAEIDAKIAAEPNKAINYVHRAAARPLSAIDESMADLNKAVSLEPGNVLALAVRGNHFYLKQEHAKAVADLEKADKLDPNHVVVKLWLGRAYERSGDQAAAEKVYQATAALAPTNGRAVGEWGRFLADQNRLDESIAQLTKAIELAPTMSIAHLNRGVSYRMAGKLDQALPDVSKYIELEPTTTSGYYERIDILQRIFDEARPNRKASDLDPALADVDSLMKISKEASHLKIKGDILKRQGNAKASLEAYNAAIEINPEYAEAYYERGVLWYQNNYFEDAANDITEVIRLQPDNLQMYRDRAECYLNFDRYQEALADCQFVLRKEPNDIQTRYKRAQCWDGLQEWAKAIADYSEVIKANPKHDMALNNRGSAYTYLNENDLAIQDFEAAIAIDPDYAQARKNLGVTQRNEGRIEESIKAFEDALARHRPPEQALSDAMHSLLYTELASSQRQAGDDTQGLQSYSKALEIDPENIRALNYRAWMTATSPDDSLRQGEQALKDATKAAELTKRENADVLDTLAAAYAETGDFEQAVTTLYEAEALVEDASIYRSRRLFYSNEQPYRQGAKFEFQIETEDIAEEMQAVAGAIGAEFVPTEAFGAIILQPRKMIDTQMIKQIPGPVQEAFFDGLIKGDARGIYKPQEIDTVKVVMFAHESLPPVIIVKFNGFLDPSTLETEGMQRKQFEGKSYLTDGYKYIYMADPQTLIRAEKLESLKMIFKGNTSPSRLRNKLRTTKIGDEVMYAVVYSGTAPNFFAEVAEKSPAPLSLLAAQAETLTFSMGEQPALNSVIRYWPKAGTSESDLKRLKGSMETGRDMLAGQAAMALSQAPFEQAGDLARLVNNTLSNTQITQTDEYFEANIDGAQLQKWIGEMLPEVLQQLGTAPAPQQEQPAQARELPSDGPLR